MKKKIATLFLIVFLGGLFFPLVSLAGFYGVEECCWEDIGGISGVFDDNDKLVGPCVTTNVCYEGLVPCGKEVRVGGTWQDGKCTGGTLRPIRCQFCHFFVMLDGIIDFALIYIVFPIAVLMLVVGGIMFMFAMFGGAELLPGSIKGGPKLLSQAKSLIKSVIIGLIIIFAAYLIIGVVLVAIGLSETNPLREWITAGGFTIHCPIKIPDPNCIITLSP